MTMNSDFRITETNKFTASNPLYITNENSNESLEFDPSSASTNQKECSSTGHSISSKLRHSIQNYPVCWIFGTLTTLCISIAIVVLCVILIKHSRTTSSPPTLANQLLVETTAGLIHGFYLPYKSSITGDVINITAFRGVPFARSPIEGLRWQPPIPPTPWNSTLMTLEFREPCVQPLGDPMNTGSEGSEDCLYLNVYVYRPPTASSQSLLPVLFYIHGGKEDVVVLLFQLAFLYFIQISRARNMSINSKLMKDKIKMHQFKYVIYLSLLLLFYHSNCINSDDSLFSI